ncbi:UdgX family uracil-DNA binding protein [Mycolicibacterium phlei]
MGRVRRRRGYPFAVSERATAAQFVPDSDDLTVLAYAAQGCRGCDLHRGATQVVFGDGPRRADLMLVGEQPGDQEDRAGTPFVGPAGRLLDRALEEAGVDRAGLYVTNAVKHFKFAQPQRGQRRIHKTPSRTEVVACRPWLIAELAAVQPEVLVLMGATAAQSLLGSGFRLTQHRGELLRLPGNDFDGAVVVSPHPSSILRGRPADRDRAFHALVADLRFAADQRGR